MPDRLMGATKWQGGQDLTISSTTQTQPQTKLSPGTCQGFYIQWQGKLYGPYANEKEMAQSGFRFDGGEPLADPFRGKNG